MQTQAAAIQRGNDFDPEFIPQVTYHLEAFFEETIEIIDLTPREYAAMKNQLAALRNQKGEHS